jgi:thymidylate kinase
VTKPGLRDWAEGHDLIVLDGCDGAGKTTLAAALANRHGHSTVHAGLSPEGTDLFAKYHAMLARAGRLVLDRSFVSELVYGPLDRGHSRLTFEQAAHLATDTAQRGGILVHLTGRADKIAARLLARDGRAPALPRISALTSAYADVFTRLADHAPVITIDTTAAGA